MKKLMIDMLKQTTAYTCGNVDFTENGDGIAVYGKKTVSPAFSNPALAAMYEGVGLHTMCTYNEINNRVELIVFH